MKTNSEAQKQLLKNLIKCLNTNTPFSQVGQAFHQATGVKPKTSKPKPSFSPAKPKSQRLMMGKNIKS